MEYGDFNAWLAIVALLLAIYYFISVKYNYWRTRGVKGPRPLPFVGNFGSIFLQRLSMVEFEMELYKRYKSEPFIGVYSGLDPILLVKDPAFIKDILIKNFALFANREPDIPSDKVDVFAFNLFRIDAKRWRPLRGKLSPTFSSGKLKNMFHLMKQCAANFGQYLDHLIPQEKDLDCNLITSKFTVDVIGSCILGMELKAMGDDTRELLQMGKKLMRPTLKSYVKELLRKWPRFFDIVGNLLFDHDVIDYFNRMTLTTIDYRLKNNVTRHDFMDILTNFKKNPAQLPELEVTDRLLIAQVVAFFVAGYFTSANAMNHLLFELALHPHIQEKLRAEIMRELAMANGELEYDRIRKLTYLDAVFKETLRKYPPVTHLMRQSLADYTFPATQPVHIPKGQMIWIPVHAIHHDPAFYPEPHVFNPERFAKGGDSEANSVPYLAFGDGLRNCIGARFAAYQSKIGVIEILKNFKIDVCEKSSFKYGIRQPRDFLLVPMVGTHLNFKRLAKE